MQKTFTLEKILKTSDCDMNSAWKLSAVLQTMQDLSGMHSEALGIGYHVMREKGLVWAVGSYEVQMDSYPHYGDKVVAVTWPTVMRHGFYLRYYSFRDENGVEFGRASGMWILMRLADRTMERGNLLEGMLPDNSDLKPALVMPGRLPAVTGEKVTEVFHPRYSDIDDNLHVNNVRYLDWCCDALGIECLQKQQISRLIINYSREIRPQDEVEAAMTHTENAFSYRGSVEGTAHFTVDGLLVPRA
ncbi:MAG: thioesterase [Clostridia bacterium]|nr:thioesterase [Clostridia bacterium]